MKRKKLITILLCVLFSCGYCISDNAVAVSNLCLATHHFNPNVEDIADQPEGVQFTIGAMEIAIGACIGFINPIAGIAYSF